MDLCPCGCGVWVDPCLTDECYPIVWLILGRDLVVFFSGCTFNMLCKQECKSVSLAVDWASVVVKMHARGSRRFDSQILTLNSRHK